MCHIEATAEPPLFAELTEQPGLGVGDRARVAVDQQAIVRGSVDLVTGTLMAALRRLVPNQVTATRGSSERRQYESHTVTGTEGQQ